MNPEQGPSTTAKIGAALALPFTMAVVVPAALWFLRPAPRLAGFWRLALGALGVLAAGAGLALLASTVALFHRQGRGTLAPWNPTRRLVLHGPYRRVRNPMISGVCLLLLGEAALAASPVLALWALLFFGVNAAYIPLSEEPGLRKRFGSDYERYCAAVPRWLPRLKPWAPE